MKLIVNKSINLYPIKKRILPTALPVKCFTSYFWTLHLPKLDGWYSFFGAQMNIRKYIWDAHNSPNEYSNIFGWLKIVRMNIQIYSGGKKLYERMSEYIWLTENDQIYSEMNIFGWKYLNIFEYMNIQHSLSLMESIMTGSSEGIFSHSCVPFFYNNSSNQSEEQDLAESQPTHHTSLIPIF